MRRYPCINLTTSLQDAHIYIFKKWVIELIKRNEKITSLRTDLLPVLAKMQWQSNLRKREGIDERTSPILGSKLTKVLPPHSSVEDPESDLNIPSNLRRDSPITVSIYITSEYTLRANSLPTYLLLNHHLSSLAPQPKKHPSSTAGSKTSISQNSLVAENSTLGERIQVRKSVIGKNVSVGSKSVIKGSVIMDGVELGEGVSLEGCVVCRGGKVGSGCKLVECFVGAGYQVEKGLTLSKQNLVELEELEDEDDDEDEE